jgi:hypothetical protein
MTAHEPMDEGRFVSRVSFLTSAGSDLKKEHRTYALMHLCTCGLLLFPSRRVHRREQSAREESTCSVYPKTHRFWRPGSNP